MFLTCILLTLLLIYSPTLVALVWCKWRDTITVFLLNTAWMLVSLIIPTHFSEWMSFVSNILLFISYLLMFQFAFDVDKEG